MNEQRFSENQLQDLKQAFRLFDREEHGIITTEEIGSVLRKLGLFPTELELQQILNDIDIDGDGTFSFDEFVQLMFNMGSLTQVSAEQEDKELKAAFQVFNRTGDGYISSIDLRSVLQSLGEYLTNDESNFFQTSFIFVEL
jgi:calmodulin